MRGCGVVWFGVASGFRGGVWAGWGSVSAEGVHWEMFYSPCVLGVVWCTMGILPRDLREPELPEGMGVEPE